MGSSATVTPRANPTKNRYSKAGAPQLETAAATAATPAAAATATTALEVAVPAAGTPARVDEALVYFARLEAITRLSAQKTFLSPLLIYLLSPP